MSRRPKAQVRSLPAAPAAKRRPPRAPDGLGPEGLATWRYVWKLTWLTPERHMPAVRRYCALQDVLWAAFAAVAEAGVTSEGSHKQSRSHPAMAEIRMLSTESRLLEIELGLTPASEAKAGVPAQRVASALDEMRAERLRKASRADGYDDDDPRRNLKALS